MARFLGRVKVVVREKWEQIPNEIARHGFWITRAIFYWSCMSSARLTSDQRVTFSKLASLGMHRF